MIENEEATADLLFVTQNRQAEQENKKYLEQKIAEKVNTDPVSIPSNYIEVKLSSLGKLTAPSSVHVRNYTFEEALELSEIDEDNEKEIMIKVLNELLWEDIDANDLHEEEAVEILLNIYAKWWGSKLEGFRYQVDESLPQSLRNKNENTSIAEIPISNLNTLELSEKVSEPFELSNGKDKIKLRLPRMKTGLIAKDFVNKKYVTEETKYAGLKRKIRLREEYSQDEYDEYMSYLRERGKDYLRAYQAQLVDSVNEKKVEDFPEALRILSELDLTIWKEYNRALKNNFVFGVDKEVTFDCTVNHTPITRRFQFRPMDFLPSVESENDTGYTLSFG